MNKIEEETSWEIPFAPLFKFFNFKNSLIFRIEQFRAIDHFPI